MEEDSSGVLGYLMHYPDMPSVTPVLDYADMIKRCVLGACCCNVLRHVFHLSFLHLQS
jgi:hypothetical protein